MDRCGWPSVGRIIWSRKFFVLADLAANARRKAQGKTSTVISPIAFEAVRRIDVLFDIEREINGQGAD
jgi:transposase